MGLLIAVRRQRRMVIVAFLLVLGVMFFRFQPHQHDSVVDGDDTRRREPKSPPLWALKRLYRNPDESEVHGQMLYDQTSSLLFFTHVMKTGGTSLSRLLLSVFRDQPCLAQAQESNVFHENNIKIMESWNCSQWKACPVLFSHDTVHHFAALVQKDLACNQPLQGQRFSFKPIIMLRDPVNQRASYFEEKVCHDTHVPMGWNPQHCQKFNTAEKWLESEYYQHTAYNMQLRHALAVTATVEQIVELELELLQRQRPRLGGPSYEEKSRKHMRQQLEQSYAWVGITERWEESICLLFYVAGWECADFSAFHRHFQARMKTERPRNKWLASKTVVEKLLRIEWEEVALVNEANDLLTRRVHESLSEIYWNVVDSVSMPQGSFIGSSGDEQHWTAKVDQYSKHSHRCVCPRWRTEVVQTLFNTTGEL